MSHQLPELLPCPFCGADPLRNEIAPHTHNLMLGDFKMPDHPGSSVIECPKCDCGLIGDTAESVTAAWNTRTIASAARRIRKNIGSAGADGARREARNRTGLKAMTLDIEKERREFEAQPGIKESYDLTGFFAEGEWAYNDRGTNFAFFDGWLAAKRSMLGSAEPVNFKDALRWSKANLDYHGYIAFTPDQLKSFVDHIQNAPPASVSAEPDWSSSKTLLSEMWKNPSIPMPERLQIADGAVRFRDEVIANLRQQLASASPSTDAKDSERLFLAGPALYQRRMLPNFGNNPWGPWEDCSAGTFGDIKRLGDQSKNQWVFETRVLYAAQPIPCPDCKGDGSTFKEDSGHQFCFHCDGSGVSPAIKEKEQQ